MPDGDMSLERYAAIGACLRHFPRGARAAVLERVGSSPEDWEASRRVWSAAIEANVAGGGSLLTTWSKHFEHFGQRLREIAPNIDSLDLSMLVSPAPTPTVEPEPTKARDLPSYMVAPSPAPPQAPAPQLRSGDWGLTAGTTKTPMLTADYPDGLPIKGPALPFTPGSPSIERSSAPPLEPRMSGTLQLDGVATSRPRTMPFQIPTSPAPSAGAVPLTLNQYAALKAELAAFPDHSELVWARHGLANVTARSATDQHWAGLLASDPAKQQRFQAVYNQYVSQWARPR